jgi:plasmid stabilization system protein ParE
MEHINSQDSAVGMLVMQRLQNAIDIIASQPGIGTPTERPNLRRFPIPRTGHTIEYRTTPDAITIVNWIRQARVKKI